jgi:23S rRNA (uracil1939-C5)-methyltransferase
MSVRSGQEIELLVERPAAGGRMIARHDGEVLLVAGAIPGERVLARVTRAERRVAFASTVKVLEGSDHRRETAADPACGGCLYAFIDYPQQLQLKAQIIRDAFGRIGHVDVPFAIEVTGSPEREYRMRARFHVRDGAAGFYREGTHELCDARATGQLLEASIDAVETAVGSLLVQGTAATSVELSENIAADQRALHLDVAGTPPLPDAVRRAVAAAGLTGCTVSAADGAVQSAGDPLVSDPLPSLTGELAGAGVLRRHPEAFFQGNRFLIGPLVRSVIEHVGDGSVLDLYAGVGLFAVALAATGRAQIIAVEADRTSGGDLLRNAEPYYDQLRVHRVSVEAYLARARDAVGTLIVDPPRTGMSKEASEGITRTRAQRIIYVSCDAPTMARDARRIVDAGYALTSLRGFDLFPNTPHVEAVGIFDL